MGGVWVKRVARWSEGADGRIGVREKGRKTGRRRSDAFYFCYSTGSAACTLPFPAEFRDPRCAVTGIYCGHPQGCIYIHKHNGAS